MNNWYENYVNDSLEKEASLKTGLVLSLISFLSGTAAWFEAEQIKKFLDKRQVPYEQFSDAINQINNTDKSIDEIDKSDVVLADNNIDEHKDLPDEKYVDIDKLLDILQIVESNNDPDAIGDNGKAYGILQIWEGVIEDVNRIYGTNYVHEDAFNPEKARDIAKKYLDFYGNHYSKKTNNQITYEVLSRIWNGGPTGYAKTKTDPYWEKVNSYL